ncbi:MAG: hypothetical protein RLY20_447 [Verrucomicrobiota bacterium]|jgi:hypothetical protein
MNRAQVHAVLRVLALLTFFCNGLSRVAYATAQMQDGQDYAAATSTPTNGRSPWLMASSGGPASAATSFIGIYAGDLASTTTPGLAALTNNVNPAAHLQLSRAGNSSRAYYRSIGAAITNGSVYFSLLLNVAANPTTNDEVLCELIPTVTSGTYPGNPAANDALTLHARQGSDSTHFNLGIQSLGGATAWASNQLAIGTDYLLVLQFVFGAGQPCQLFINPNPGAAQPVATATATKGAASEPANLGTVLFWESSTNTTGTFNYDTMRVDATWANVTPASETPMRVLFLGNSLIGISASYSNDIPGILTALCQSLGTEISCSAIANSSWELQDHATNAPSTNAVISGSFDVVVLQEQSDNPSQPSVRTNRFFPASRTLNTLITNHAAQTMFYQTWGYLNGDTSAHCNSYDIPAQYKTCDGGYGSFTAMNIATRQGYALIANELGSTISPVGLAWARVRAERPGLNLYITDDSLADRHPNSLGAYLAACVFYSALFGRSPEGSTCYSTNNPADAQYLQRIAAETVLNDPFATDIYGFGANHFRWAYNWQNFTNLPNTSSNTILISGASATPSPAVKIDSNVGTISNLTLGALESVFGKPGQGRLYLATNGSLVVTGVMLIGKDGDGYVRQSGGTLFASQILRGAGNAEITFSGGQLGFSQFGSVTNPFNLLNGGTLILSNSTGPSRLFGNFTNTTSATVAVTLMNTNDCLLISGSAALAGTLQLTNGFAVTPGQRFTLLSAASVSGSFSNLNLPPVGADGIGFTTSQTSTSVVATVVNFTPHFEAPALAPNGFFQANLSGVPGSRYLIQTATNLSSWANIATNLAPFTVNTTNVVNEPQRFFRAIYLP